MNWKYLKFLFNDQVQALLRRAGTFVAGVLAAHGATAQQAEAVGLLVIAALGVLFDVSWSKKSRDKMKARVERDLTKKLHTNDRHVQELRDAALRSRETNREVGMLIIEKQETEE